METSTAPWKQYIMNDYSPGGSVVGTVLKWMVILVLAVIALKVGLAIAGFVIGVGFFALFTVGPILLVGWLVLKALRHLSRPSDTSTI